MTPNSNPFEIFGINAVNGDHHFLEPPAQDFAMGVQTKEGAIRVHHAWDPVMSHDRHEFTKAGMKGRFAGS
jgi:hypothetical protein